MCFGRQNIAMSTISTYGWVILSNTPQIRLLWSMLNSIFFHTQPVTLQIVQRGASQKGTLTMPQTLLQGRMCSWRKLSPLMAWDDYDCSSEISFFPRKSWLTIRSLLREYERRAAVGRLLMSFTQQLLKLCQLWVCKPSINVPKL